MNIPRAVLRVTSEIFASCLASCFTDAAVTGSLPFFGCKRSTGRLQLTIHESRRWQLHGYCSCHSSDISRDAPDSTSPPDGNASAAAEPMPGNCASDLAGCLSG